jgi:hypothetical protein
VELALGDDDLLYLGWCLVRDHSRRSRLIGETGGPPAARTAS